MTMLAMSYYTSMLVSTLFPRHQIKLRYFTLLIVYFGFIYRFMSITDFFITQIGSNLKIIIVQVIIFIQMSITFQKLGSISRREAKEVMQVITDLQKDQEKDE